MEQAKEIKTVEPIKVEEDYSVTVVDKERLLNFFKEGANLDGLYNVVQEKARALVADVTTADGVSKIKSTARQIASIKKRVDDIGKDVVAELKDLPKQIDANRKKWREDMEALQEEIRRPVTEIEEREAEIDRIKTVHQQLISADSATIRQNIEAVKAIALTAEKWKESLEKATKAVTGEIAALETMLKAAEKREAEARELEELRRKQEEAERIIREQKIREEAERKEAERKAREEAEARAAAEKARMEREKEEAERKAAEAERAAQEAREREEAAKAELARNAEERKTVQDAPAPVPMSKTLPQPKPSKWTEEQKAVNKRIVADIAATIEPELKTLIAGHSDPGYRLAAEESAKAVVKAILTGKINNLKVEY